MDTIKKFVILAIVIVLAVVFGPLALRIVLPSWGFDKDLETGKIAFRPLAGVMLERQIGDNAWEQFVVDWVGPGTVQVIQYGEGETGGRERLATKEQRVAIDIARAYTLAPSPDAFPLVIAEKYDAAPETSLTGTDGKLLETPRGTLYFAPEAALEITREGGYFGFRKLKPGDVLRLSGKKWSYAGQGFTRTGPSREGAGSFAILQGVQTAPMSLDRSIETISTIMLMPGSTADALRVDRDPLAGAGRSVTSVFHASSWTVPLPAELDLTKILTAEQRDSLSIPGSIAIGYGYAHDTDSIPSYSSSWTLRCLDETEIWVPYRSPI